MRGTRGTSNPGCRPGCPMGGEDSSCPRSDWGRSRSGQSATADRGARKHPSTGSNLTCTGLVCQCVEDVSGVVGEVGLRGYLLPCQGDRDVLQRAEGADDLS